MTATHTIEMDAATVTKRFRSWNRGEPRREWQALNLLAVHAPGLAGPSPAGRRPGRRTTRDHHEPPARLAPRRRPGRRRRPAESLRPSPDEPARRRTTTPPGRSAAPHLAPRTGPGPGTLADHHRPALGDQPVTAAAYRAARQWVTRTDIDRAVQAPARPVLGQADGNLATFLWDDHDAAIRIVDFEDSGVSDSVFEIAEITEHLTAWTSGTLDAQALLEHLPLTDGEAVRLRQHRRLLATWWLLMLLPGADYHSRNTAGTLERQAARCLDLLER